MNLGQWQKEVLEELHVQVELTWDTLSIPWAQKWVTLLMQQMSWDPLCPSTA